MERQLTMARKNKTTKAVARDSVTLNSVFTGIANAIRERGATGTMRPTEMAERLADACGLTSSTVVRE